MGLANGYAGSSSTSHRWIVNFEPLRSLGRNRPLDFCILSVKKVNKIILSLYSDFKVTLKKVGQGKERKRHGDKPEHRRGGVTKHSPSIPVLVRLVEHILAKQESGRRQKGGGDGDEEPCCGLSKQRGKQKAAVATGDTKNRKALDDIGNLVNLHITDGKPITRPITRSFGAQMLTNAQAAAASKNLQKQVALPTDGARNKKPIVKNPKPDVVIDINPATVHKAKQERKNCRASSSKKKIHSLTSVLSARSKIACGIEDIDAVDVDNELAMVEYVEELYKFYKQHEKLCLPKDYMSSQMEINAKMRSILVDWLIEVHHKFELMPETLFLTMHIIDRYLSVESVLRKELQLVGVGSMLIACKYEEIWAPEILKMEKEILNKLDWSLTFPTTYVFIIRFLKAAASDKEMENMAFFFSELALMHYSMLIYCPSMVAASAVYAARCTLKKSPMWNKTLEYHTGFSEEQLMECAKHMVDFHSSAPDSKLTVVYRKYSKEELGGVALQPPATKFT
ncbi:hypothetical protein HPP92_002948 [Vanilla planifolia]|uniref:Cyclin N-terminal domain-containing protein n=1 Tax=Vanilla planifolia TaxID=51239 RepID=A0A835SAS8_VANPL|nr:hypothetical protein HPP92_002948 [Vanilla planifolia]